jgi:thiamine biosynthesis lipoprotein
MSPAVANRKVLPPDAHGVRSLEFTALGTQCLIKFRQPNEHKALVFAADALAWIDRFEADFSRFRPDSIVSRVNAAAGVDWVAVDANMERMLDLCDDLHRRTNGILDPTLLPLLGIWDWKRVHPQIPDAGEVRAALALTGWEKVERRPGAVRLPLPGMGLDFGGFGKEYAVDCLARLARRQGIADVLVDLGRDIFAGGGNGRQPFWHVGMEDANKPGNCWGCLAVSGLAVSASGDYARHFTHEGVRYGHIVDPRSGWPVTGGVRAVTVIAPTCLEAGIFSTAVFVLGTREGFHLASLARGVEVCAQTDAGFESTRGFSGFLVGND